MPLINPVKSYRKVQQELFATCPRITDICLANADLSKPLSVCTSHTHTELCYCMATMTTITWPFIQDDAVLDSKWQEQATGTLMPCRWELAARRPEDSWAWTNIRPSCQWLKSRIIPGFLWHPQWQSNYKPSQLIWVSRVPASIIPGPSAGSQFILAWETPELCWLA